MIATAAMTMTTMTVITTRVTMIDEWTHLRLETELMAVDSDILAWCDGRMDG